MRVLYLTNIPAPYRVEFFNELSKYCELTVCFERASALNRDESWYKYNHNFNAIILKSIKIGDESSISFEFIKMVKKDYDFIIIGGYSTLTGMISIFYLVIIIVILNYSDSLINVIDTSANNVISRISNTYVEDEALSNDIRIKYLLEIPSAIVSLGMMIIFGTGFGIASFGYGNNVNFPSIYKNLLPYDMENTYLSYFYDVGIIGLIIYIFMLYKIIKIYKKNHSTNGDAYIYFALCSMTVSSFFYHYTIFAPHMLLIICSLINMKSKNNKYCF